MTTLNTFSHGLNDVVDRISGANKGRDLTIKCESCEKTNKVYLMRREMDLFSLRFEQKRRKRR